MSDEAKEVQPKADGVVAGEVREGAGEGAREGGGAGVREAPSATVGERLLGLIVDVLKLGMVVLAALSGRSCLIDHYVIPSGSMIPTLLEQDRVVVFKAAYGLRVPFTHVELARFEEPGRGDVIVFSSPTDDTTFIKRVVGLPGDIVEVRDGRVYLNGELVRFEEGSVARGEPIEMLEGKAHRVQVEDDGGPDFGPTKVPAESFFMLGDNRGNSQDSRSWGFLPRARVLGHALRIYYRSGTGFVWSPL